MKKFAPIMLIIGLLTIAVGVLMPIMTNNPFGMTFRYVFAVGAALTLIARFMEPSAPAGTPVRIKRLMRLESWSSLLFCVAAFFAFYSAPVIRDWLAFTLAGAAIQIYSSIALNIAASKSAKK
ncbi:MAG: hypothetical protein HDS64_10440 [Bacteroidales bacterium]|nr:hypothetical protein [Bacteroidales bacterium]MBD5281728.1 hypothetical protein [Bacteroides sp.]MDE6033029.1 hypothetical protein [Muribaculaceae bacterium]MBD5341817.1 hypothetical protein [Bacteroides sp.]MBD5363966.1 hypothetical protein [Bacteroides sp.]